MICLTIILVIPIFGVIQYIEPKVENYILSPFFIPASSIFTGALMSLLCFNSFISSRYIVIKNFNFIIFTLAIIFVYFIYYMSAKGLYGKILLPCGNLLTNLCFAYMILFSIIRRDNFIFRILNSKIFVQIGIISYSLYIWQQLFIIPKGNYPILEQYFYFPFNLILVFIFGFLSFYFLEKPFLKLKERFSIY